MAGNQVLFGKDIIEPYGNGIVMYDSLHAHIHAGKAWKIGVSGTGIAQNGTVMIEITGILDKDLHFKNSEFYSSKDLLRIEIIENPTITHGTTAAQVRNLNRNHSDAASFSAFTDPTAISGGTVMENKYMDSGANNSRIGGIPSEFEWLLKQGNTYLIRLTNLDAQAATMFVDMVVYTSW